MDVLGCVAADTHVTHSRPQQRRPLNYTNSRRVPLITTGPRACTD